MTQAQDAVPLPGDRRPTRARGPGHGSASSPFFLFALLFLILPTLVPDRRRFQDAGRPLHARQHREPRPAVDPQRLLDQHPGQRRLGAGRRDHRLLLARAVVLGGLPGWLRPTLVTFSGVASNFAGIPLAFAFLATLGRTGLVTDAPDRAFGINLYAPGFNLSELLGPDDHLSLLPDPADGADPAAGARRAEAGVARGLRDPRREPLAVLAPRRAADAVAEPARHHAPALRQRLRRGRHRLCADRLLAQHRADPALRADPRRRAARPESRLCAGARHDRHHRGLQLAYIWLRARSERWMR